VSGPAGPADPGHGDPGHADVVIVGAGASGGVAALRLARAGLRVVCLEQGDWPDRAAYPSARARLAPSVNVTVREVVRARRSRCVGHERMQRGLRARGILGPPGPS
jgi:choline dehydrogenase-like flavoprotein